MTMNGIDISGWQADIDLNAVAGSVDFVIVKATEGTGFVAKECDRFYQSAKKLGKKLGFYHYARNNDATKEADYFYKHTKNYFHDAIPVLDWEENQSVAWVNEFVRRIHDLTGVWPWIYANAWRFNQGGVESNCGRWVAGYPKTGTVTIDYGENHSCPYACDGIMVAWQFSSSCRIPGYGGNLDANVFYGDESTWDKYAGKESESEPKPSPKPPLPDVLKKFTDLDSEAWYVNALEKVIENGWMSGYDETHFGPTDILTRGQSVCVLANFSGFKAKEPFNDVKAEPYYYHPCIWAYDNGVASGNSGLFRPDSDCTREELMVMIYNMAGKPDVDNQPTGFKDWDNVSSWAQNAVAWCVKQGVISGSNGMINPKSGCSRVEAAAMIVNYNDKK